MLRVMIVEDQHLLREGLKLMLESDGSIQVVTEAGSAQEALDRLEDSECQIILMDISLPDRDGLWCIRSMRERGCPLPILVVTTHETDEVVRQALAAGANGYVLKTASPQELRRALSEVRQGGSYVQPTLLSGVIKSLNEPPSREEGPSLTRLEREVLTLAANGLTPPELRERLSLSEATLNSHLRSLYRKLKVDDLDQALVQALETGLIPGFAPTLPHQDQAPPELLPPGLSLGSYTIGRVIGGGGMAVVYEADNPLLERRAAVKVINRSLTVDAQATARFLTEARAAARIEHPNVVGIYDVGVWSGLSYIVMQLVEGKSAQELLRQGGPLAWREATRILVEACQGLAAAHQRQVLHRDIKPGNILIGEGTVKLSDFGLAKLCEPGASGEAITRAGTILGTPEFMSPEQCRGGALDVRTDVYQLGATYHALLTGVPPFHHYQQFFEVMRAHCSERPPDPAERCPGLPEGCSAVVLKAMQKDPGRRHASVEELLGELQALR